MEEFVDFVQVERNDAPCNVYKGRRPKIVFTSGRMTCLTSRSWKGYKGLDLSVIGLYPTVVENKSSWMLVWVSGFVTLSHMSQNVVEQVPIHKLPHLRRNCIQLPVDSRLRDSRSITNRLIMNLLWSSERRAVGGCGVFLTTLLTIMRPSRTELKGKGASCRTRCTRSLRYLKKVEVRCGAEEIHQR